jgi:hypothetical protein
MPVKADRRLAGCPRDFVPYPVRPSAPVCPSGQAIPAGVSLLLSDFNLKRLAKSCALHFA